MKLIKTVAIVAALGATPALIVAVPSNAGAASGPRVSFAGAHPDTLPTSTIKGSPAKFKPAALTATGAWDGTSSCTTAVASFNINNAEAVTEKFKVTATGITGALKIALPAGQGTSICVTTGYSGVLTAKLKVDSKTLNVTF